PLLGVNDSNLEVGELDVRQPGVEFEQRLAECAVQRMDRAVPFGHSQALLSVDYDLESRLRDWLFVFAAPLYDAAKASQVEKRARAAERAHEQQFERTFRALVTVSIVLAVRNRL